MALYNKALNSLEDVEREKKALKQKLRDIEAEGVSPLSFFSGKGASKDEDDEPSIPGMDTEGKNMMENVMSMAGPVLSTVMDLAFPILGTKIGGTVKKTLFKGVKSVAGNVIGGYLKWKAVELSAKALWKLAHRQSKKDK